MVVLFLICVFTDWFSPVDSFEIKESFIGFYEGECLFATDRQGKLFIIYDVTKNAYILNKDGKFIDTLAIYGESPEKIDIVLNMGFRNDTLYIIQYGGKISTFIPERKQFISSRILKNCLYPFFFRVTNDYFIISSKQVRLQKRKLIWDEVIGIYEKNTGKYLKSFFKPPEHYLKYEPREFFEIPPIAVLDENLYIFGTFSPELWIYDLDGNLKKHCNIKSKYFVSPKTPFKEPENEELVYKAMEEWNSTWTVPILRPEENEYEYIIYQHYSKGKSKNEYFIWIVSKNGVLEDEFVCDKRLIGSNRKDLYYFFKIDKDDNRWLITYKFKEKK